MPIGAVDGGRACKGPLNKNLGHGPGQSQRFRRDVIVRAPQSHSEERVDRKGIRDGADLKTPHKRHGEGIREDVVAPCGHCPWLGAARGCMRVTSPFCRTVASNVDVLLFRAGEDLGK